MPANKKPKSDNAFPRLLYKLMKPEHAEALVKRGEIMIGTLSGYRQIEREFSKDSLEGTSIHVGIIDDRHGSSFPEEFRVSKDHIGRGHGNVFMEECAVIEHRSLPEYYVWCSSLRLGTEMIRRRDGYDACIQVFDPQGFITELDNTLRSAVPHCRTLYHGSVQYGTPIYTISGPNPASQHVLVKPNTLRWQREYRTAWYSGKTFDKPMILTSPELRKYCRIMLWEQVLAMADKLRDDPAKYVSRPGQQRDIIAGDVRWTDLFSRSRLANLDTSFAAHKRSQQGGKAPCPCGSGKKLKKCCGQRFR